MITPFAAFLTIFLTTEIKRTNIKKLPAYSPLDKKSATGCGTITMGHNILLIEKVKNIDERFWYIQESVKEGWSRDILAMMIKNDAYTKHKTQLKIKNIDL